MNQRKNHSQRRFRIRKKNLNIDNTILTKRVDSVMFSTVRTEGNFT